MKVREGTRSAQGISAAASEEYKRQVRKVDAIQKQQTERVDLLKDQKGVDPSQDLSAKDVGGIPKGVSVAAAANYEAPEAKTNEAHESEGTETMNCTKVTPPRPDDGRKTTATWLLSLGCLLLVFSLFSFSASPLPAGASNESATIDLSEYEGNWERIEDAEADQARLSAIGRALEGLT